MNYILFGAGRWGKQCITGIQKIKDPAVNVLAFVDNNPFLWNTTLGGVSIFSPSQLNTMNCDKIIVCTKYNYEQILRQLVDDFCIPKEMILHYLTDPLPIRVDVSAENTYLAALSEFGTEMIGWIPYLAYLKTRGVHLKTLGRKGSSVYYENISDEHIEIDDAYFHYGGWPYIKNIEKAEHDTGYKIFSISNEIRGFSIYVNGIEWQVHDYHSRYSASHLCKPAFPKQNILDIVAKKNIHKGIVTINNKSYRNDAAGCLRNCFSQAEVEMIIEFLIKKNYFVIYNDFSAAFRNTQNNPFDMYLPPINVSGFGASVLILDQYSDGTEDKWDRMQLECWQNSDFVIQVPGGAAAVVELLGVRKFNFMQKGEYQDDIFLSKLYGGQSDTFYEVRHMIAYMEKEMREGRL